MQAGKKSVFKAITITHRLQTKDLEKNQELKEELCKGLVDENIDNVDFEDSINHGKTMYFYLF